MKLIKSCSVVLLTFGVSAHVYAQEAESVTIEDETMVVVEDETQVEDVVNRIELPESAAPEAVESSAAGLETANAAREQGRDFGQQQASEARSRGVDARENARSAAQDAAREASQEAGQASREAAQEAGQASREEARNSIPEDVATDARATRPEAPADIGRP